MTWAEAEAGILFRGRLWQRELDRRGRRARSEDVQLVEWEGGAGFQTVPPNTLAARGFAERGADGRPRIYGLDARTVLSDAFLSGHCFRVVLGEEERAGDVGLAFEPASRSGRIVDVEGVLWLDASTAMLEELEYRFTNLELVGLSEVRAIVGAGGVYVTGLR